MLKALLIIAALVFAFIVWRVLSVPLGMRRRDQELRLLLEPVGGEFLILQ